MVWRNERKMPEELEELLNNTETPKDLWVLIAKARDEIRDYGAVTYTTKTNVENHLRTINKLLNKDST